MLELDVLLEGPLGAVEAFAVGDFALEPLFDFLSSSAGPLGPVFLLDLVSRDIFALVGLLHAVLPQNVGTSIVLMRLFKASHWLTCLRFSRARWWATVYIFRNSW